MFNSYLMYEAKTVERVGIEGDWGALAGREIE